MLELCNCGIDYNVLNGSDNCYYCQHVKSPKRKGVEGCRVHDRCMSRYILEFG